MAMEVHVQGQIEPGRLADFREAVERYRAYAHEHGYTEPEVLFGLSGKMNTIRLIYTYEDLNGYEEHETRTLTDRQYAEVGQQMGVVVGSVRYEIYRQIWPSGTATGRAMGAAGPGLPSRYPCSSSQPCRTRNSR